MKGRKSKSERIAKTCGAALAVSLVIANVNCAVCEVDASATAGRGIQSTIHVNQQSGLKLTPTPTPSVSPLLKISPTPTATQAPAATQAPVVTQAPVATQAPVVTEAPVATQAPAATQAPVVTEAPAATQAPVVTEAPAATQAPAETQAPAATQAPSAPEASTAPAPESSITPETSATPYPESSSAPGISATPYPGNSDMPEISATPYPGSSDMPEISVTPYPGSSDMPEISATPAPWDSVVPEVSTTPVPEASDIPEVSVIPEAGDGNGEKKDIILAEPTKPTKPGEDVRPAGDSVPETPVADSSAEQSSSDDEEEFLDVSFAGSQELVGFTTFAATKKAGSQGSSAAGKGAGQTIAGSSPLVGGDLANSIYGAPTEGASVTPTAEAVSTPVETPVSDWSTEMVESLSSDDEESAPVIGESESEEEYSGSEQEEEQVPTSRFGVLTGDTTDIFSYIAISLSSVAVAFLTLVTMCARGRRRPEEERSED